LRRLVKYIEQGNVLEASHNGKGESVERLVADGHLNTSLMVNDGSPS